MCVGLDYAQDSRRCWGRSAHSVEAEEGRGKCLQSLILFSVFLCDSDSELFASYHHLILQTFFTGIMIHMIRGFYAIAVPITLCFILLCYLRIPRRIDYSFSCIYRDGLWLCIYLDQIQHSTTRLEAQSLIGD